MRGTGESMLTLTPDRLVRRARLCAAVLGMLAVLPHGVAAQIRASEHATVSQTADGTTFTVSYFRPQARGRAPLFGKVIKMGATWTPGANWATTLEVSRDVTLDGHAVKKGKYSVWFVVRERDWTMILDPRFLRFHEERPDSTADQLRWTVRPTDGPPAEILTWSFPQVRPDGVQLLFSWGPKRVTMEATVHPSHPLPIARADAEPFLGTYEWKWDDSTDKQVKQIEVRYEGGMLTQQHTPFPDWYPRMQGQPMVRINDGWLIGAIVRDGKVWEMDSDMVYEFTMKDGKAISFEIRDQQDNLLATGTRVARR